MKHGQAPDLRHAASRRGVLSCFFGVVLLVMAGQAARAADHEIPVEALLGNKKQFVGFRDNFRKWYANEIESVPDVKPRSSKILRTEKLEDATMSVIAFEYEKGSVLYGKVGGGILVLPRVRDRSKPLVIAIHGHEHPQWGAYPTKLFENKMWPWEFVKAGYAVWAPVSMYHAEIKQVADRAGYLVSWARIVSDNLDYLKRFHLADLRHSGYVVAGLSAGGTTAFSLMAYRQDISAGIFAGADQDLDFLRREFKISGHPDCWNVKGVASYMPIQALIAPRPILFQLGRTDPFFPDGKPFPKDATFSGTSRDVLTDETAGHVLMLQSIWKLYGRQGDVDFQIHDGGHDFYPKGAMKFLQRLAPGGRNTK